MKLKNLFIISDLEGIGGVSRFEETRERNPLNDRAKELFTREVNVVIKAIKEFDAKIDIHFWDAHGKGAAVRSKMQPVAKFLPSGLFGLARYLVENRIDAVLFVGQHSMANTPNGNLCHTMSYRTIEYYKLNTKFVGEFGMRAALAGEFGIPTIFISGDDKACREALAIVPEIITCDVKKGTGLESAEYLPFDEVYEKIRHATTQSLERWQKIQPYKVKNPVTLEVKYKKGRSLKARIACFLRIVHLLMRSRVPEKCGGSMVFNANSMEELEKTNLF